MSAPTASIGAHLRQWRQRRRMSQLDLACEAEISTRHLSFVESGRATPSREMVLHLAEALEVPLRERDGLLLAAGFAPLFAARPADDPALRAPTEAMRALLAAHEPYPALLVDRHWTLLAANGAAATLVATAAAWLREPPVNVLRLSLHPEGMAPRIENLGEWREHVLQRLRRQFAHSADPVLAALARELSGYPGDVAPKAAVPDAVAVPLRLATQGGVLSLLSATMVFGTPLDAGLAEIALETFLPADAATEAALRRAAAAQ